MWRSPEPSPGSGSPPGLRATHAAWRRWWQPQKASLDHPGDVHFGLLKPISFIPWLWNGQVWPKVPYPNQTKPINWQECTASLDWRLVQGTPALQGGLEFQYIRTVWLSTHYSEFAPVAMIKSTSALQCISFHLFLKALHSTWLLRLRVMYKNTVKKNTW